MKHPRNILVEMLCWQLWMPASNSGERPRPETTIWKLSPHRWWMSLKGREWARPTRTEQRWSREWRPKPKCEDTLLEWKKGGDSSRRPACY